MLAATSVPVDATLRQGRNSGTGFAVDYASSYAVGGPPRPQGGHAAYVDALAPVEVLPAPKPQRMHWTTLVFVTGLVVCAVSLVATIAGVPARLAYDIDGPPNRNKPTTSEPLAVARSIDGNMKWIAVNTSDAPGSYVGSIKSINRNEAAIGAMVGALTTMNASVQAIDAGLAGMSDATTTMGADIDAMSATSAASGATMSALGADLGYISSSMVELAGATKELTERMAQIERKAGGIAAGGTSAALENTQALNASLPEGVPVPTTTDGEPLDQAMQRLASGGGAGGGVAYQ
jgi:hypothetical protein